MKFSDPLTRPKVHAVDFGNVPDFLVSHNIWVLWKFEFIDKTWRKVPYKDRYRKASVNNPDTWNSFDFCKKEYLEGGFDGIGFVISEHLKLIGIDIDECRNGNGFKPEVNILIEKTATYAEESPSGTGVHILGFSSSSINTRGNSSGLKLELYTQNRYFTFTGKMLSVSNELTDITEVADTIYRTMKTSDAQLSVEALDSVLSELRKDSKVTKILEGDLSEFDNDQSRADLALVAKLAKVCNYDKYKIDRVFRQTPLYRPKWDERRGSFTYGERTINKVLESRLLTTTGKTSTTHVSVSDIWDSVLQYRRHGNARGFSPGWYELERYYRPTLGEFTVLVGEPSSGKSTFMDCLTFNMAKLHGWKFCMASFETLPIERHINSLCQIYLKKPTFAFMEGAATDDEMQEAMEFLDKHYRFLVPSEDEMNMQALLTNLREEIISNGINGFVLDPFTEIDLQTSAGLSEVRLIETELRRLRQFTRIMEIHSWVLVHPTKSNESYVTSGKIKRPSLYSASGAAHFRNKADFGLVIHRTPDNYTRLYIDKVRYDVSGGLGEVIFSFDPHRREYSPVLSEEDGW